MAEGMAVKQDIKTVPMKYKKDRSEETAELARLEEERNKILQDQKEEEEDKAETESLSPEEKTFKKTFQRYNNIAIKVCEGQQYDMNFEVENEISEDDYLKMITLKTAVLIGFSLELGGLIANKEKLITDQLYIAGENFGISFQLMDDYLDVFGSAEFGKKIGGDISSNKKTYLIIKLLEKANSTDKESVLKLMNDNSEDENKIKFITGMMLKYQIDKIAKQKMDIYFDEGMKILSSISSKKNKILELKNYFEKMRERKF